MSDTAIVLAGGYSRRFGGDKARYCWQGTSLIEHVQQTASSICEEVIIVVRPDQVDQEWPAECVVCDDPALPPGPLRGVIAGLEAAAAEHAFVIACDSPAISPLLITGLLQRARQVGAAELPVIPEWAGRLQPLLAAYPSCLSGRFRQLALAGEQSITAALRQIPHEVMLEHACRQFDKHGLSFLNINSPADLELLDQHLEI